MSNRLFSKGGLFALVLIFSGVSVPCVNAQEPPAVHESASSDVQNQALQLINKGDSQAALNLVQGAIEQNPANLEYQYLLGLVYARLERLDEAEAIFTTLLNTDERNFQKVYFELASILMRKGKSEQSLDALRKARSLDPGRADYEMGLVFMRMRDFNHAVEYLKRVAVNRPDLAVNSTIQEAIAQYHLKNYKESRALLKEVSLRPLSDEKKEEVRVLLQSMEAAIRAGKPWQLIATAGLQFDSNVNQTPVGPGPVTPSGSEDMAGLISVSGRYNVIQSDPWKIGFGYNHYQLSYYQNTKLDLIGSRPSVYFQWEKAPYFATLEYVYSHYLVNNASRVDVQSLFPRFVMLHGDRFRTEVIGGLEWRFYQDTSPDDRVYHIGLTEFFLMRNGKAHLRAGYLLDYDDMVPAQRGDFTTNTGSVGFQWPVWQEKWYLDLSGSYVWRNFGFDPAMSATTKRRDEEQDLNVMLFGPIADNLQLSILFQRIWSDSNITNRLDGGPQSDPFNYKRAILTCMVTYVY